MNTREASSPEWNTHALVSATPLLPEPSRAEAVRLRCRALIACRTLRAQRTDAIAAFARVLVPVLLGAFSALYAAALFSTTLRVEGWLR